MGEGMGGILYIVVLLAVFWFLLIRPQQQQAKKRAEMLTALKAGDKVVTIGGICGKVAQITDDKIFVEVSEGVVVEFLRNAISTVETEETLNNPFEDEQETANMLFPEIRDALLSLAVENGINIEPITYSCLWGVVAYSAIRKPEIVS